MKRKFVIGGNWKLQINSLETTKNVIADISTFQSEYKNVESFLAVPYTGLNTAIENVHPNSSLKIAAQNVHYDEKGPYTGEISIEVLKEIGTQVILIGHSERRIIFGETDEILNKKLHKVLEYNITPVFCIGETAKQRNSGDYTKILEDQLAIGLKGITKEQLEKIIIAYEPVWAIDNELLNPDSEIKAATPEEAENTHRSIRNWITSNYDKEISSKIRLLYGGSMKPTNAEELLRQDNIDGGLIGGASLSTENFGPIIKIASELQK